MDHNARIMHHGNTPRRAAALRRHRTFGTLVITGACALMCLTSILAGCQQTLYAPEKATRPYPRELHQPQSIDIQVFREGEYIEVHNATANSFTDFDLWINQRYMKHVESLPAAGSVRLYVGDFWDELGEAPNAGGFWRVTAPTPIVLAEIQTAADEPLLGLVTIRQKDIRQR